MRWGIAGVAVVLLLAACAGGVDREQLDAVRQQRGGGLSQRQVLTAIDLARHDLAIDVLQLRSVTVAPGRVALEARIRGSAEEDAVAAYAFADGTQLGPTPVVPSPIGEPLMPSLFTVDQAGIERFDGMVDDALAEAGFDDGYAVGAEIRRPFPDAEPQTEVWVTEGDEQSSVLFAADGTVVEVRT